MLTAPSQDESPAVYADWLEFRAVARGVAAFSELARAWDEEYGEEDIPDMDVLAEESVNSISNEIEKRKRILGEAYPFEVNNQRILLANDVTEEQSAYLLCLYLSSAETHIINQDITDAERRLFQVISTISASGYFNADSIWFGFPRPTRDGFHTALKSVFRHRIKEGSVLDAPRPGANLKLKDGEIDIIVHKNMNDELPGQLFFYGQVASGANYHNKPLSREKIGSVHVEWFDLPPTSDFLRGIFIPFCSWHQIEGNLGLDALRTKMCVESIVYGLVFSRYRIPFYMHTILKKMREDSLGIQVDGLNEIGQVKEWRITFIAQMQEAHNAA